MDKDIEEMLSVMNPRGYKVDWSNMEGFLKSIIADPFIKDLKIACEGSTDYFKYLKEIHSRFKRFNKEFVAADVTGCSDLTNRQRLLRAMVLDYYYPDYFEMHLLPYIKDNKNSDLTREAFKLRKSKQISEGLEEKARIKMITKAEERYNKVVGIYSEDWESKFQTIKKMNAIIDANESDHEVCRLR